MRLRELEDRDLDALFAQQADPESYLLADVPTRDRPAFDVHWAKIRNDPETLLRVIEYDGTVAGHVLSFIRDGERELGYWIDRSLWGRGIASEAVAEFLTTVEVRRPLQGHIAHGNPGSQRVLEKNGFRLVGEKPGGLDFELK
jgi:RimJ/RimL family protein N-acetyltransferase